MANFRVIVDGAVLAEVLRSPRGPVFKHLFDRATVFQLRARAQINRAAGYDTKLATTVVKRPIVIGDELAVQVKAGNREVFWALYYHEGTKPHTITARNAAALYFFWTKAPAELGGPGMYSFVSVNHPGYRGNKFFTDNLAIFTSVGV